MRRLEIFVRDLKHDRLTIAKDRVTIKFRPSTTELRKAEILLLVSRVMDLEISQTMRGEFKDHDGKLYFRLQTPQTGIPALNHKRLCQILGTRENK